MQVDLRVISKANDESNLHYFTGSNFQKIAIRRIAKRLGLKIKEYGMFWGNMRIAVETEILVYQAIGRSYLAPELREDRGEIELASAGDYQAYNVAMENNNSLYNESLPQLIKALLKPESYPHSAQHVELIETHISWLLLAGEFVYKIKKPITLPFLDYGTLEKRHAFCKAELRLNQRYAPDIYLEVIAIAGTPENPNFNDDGAPIEFAVKMRRFDEAGRLDRMCARGELQTTHISDLAEVIVCFHHDAAKAEVNTD